MESEGGFVVATCFDHGSRNCHEGDIGHFFVTVMKKPPGCLALKCRSLRGLPCDDLLHLHCGHPASRCIVRPQLVDRRQSSTEQEIGYSIGKHRVVVCHRQLAAHAPERNEEISNLFHGNLLYILEPSAQKLLFEFVTRKSALPSKEVYPEVPALRTVFCPKKGCVLCIDTR